MWHGVDGGGWWMLWGGLMMLLFWGGIIVLAVWAVRSLFGEGVGSPGRVQLGAPGMRPLDTAKERYARGEIGRDEFLQMKKDLEGS